MLSSGFELNFDWMQINSARVCIFKPNNYKKFTIDHYNNLYLNYHDDFTLGKSESCEFNVLLYSRQKIKNILFANFITTIGKSAFINCM